MAILVQIIGILFYLNSYFFTLPTSQWKEYFLESYVNQFSSRVNDLFVVKSYIGDSTDLGRLGRRGIAYGNTEQILKYSRGYQFIYINTQNTTQNEIELLTKKFGTPIRIHNENYFFKAE